MLNICSFRIRRLICETAGKYQHNAENQQINTFSAHSTIDLLLLLHHCLTISYSTIILLIPALENKKIGVEAKPCAVSPSSLYLCAVPERDCHLLVPAHHDVFDHAAPQALIEVLDDAVPLPHSLGEGHKPW